MRHGPGSPPPRSARDSGGGWGWAGSGRCSGGELWAWPPSEAAPPRGERRSSLNQRTVCQDPGSLVLPSLSLVKVGTDAFPQSAEAPDTVCTGYPHSDVAISSPRPPHSCECLRLQHPLPCLSCSHLGPAFRPLTPSTPNTGSLPTFVHPPFRVCPDFCTLATRNSVSFGTFAHPPLGIPCPSQPLHTLHSEFQVPDSHWP